MNERATGGVFCTLALVAVIADNLDGAVVVSAAANLDVFALLLAVVGIGYLVAADGDPMNERATGVVFCTLALVAVIADNLDGAVVVSAVANLDVFALLLAMVGTGYLVAADGSRIFPPHGTAARPKDDQ